MTVSDKHPTFLLTHFLGDAKTQLMAAMHRWEKTTCTIFLPWTNQADWALFEPGERLASNNAIRYYYLQLLPQGETLEYSKGRKVDFKWAVHSS